MKLVTEIITEQLDAKTEIVSTTELEAILDSLEFIETVQLIEEEYGISIDDELASQCKTVGDLQALADKAA